MDEVIKGLADGVKDIGARLDKVPTMEDFEKSRAEAKAAQEQALAVKEQLDVATSDLVSLRKMLEHNLGKSGSEDFNHIFDQFVKGVWHVQKQKPVPSFLSKAVADYVTDVDAQGGFLTPRLVADEITKLTLRHGQIWPLVNKVTAPVGVEMRVPYESTLASVAWRLTGQGGAGEEIDPAIVWGGKTCRPAYINGYGKIANEAFSQPGISLPDNIVMQLISQIVRKIEWGILMGQVAATQTCTSDGILIDAGVNSQPAAATVTAALVEKFIADSLADHEGSADTSENYLVTTDAAAFALRGNAIGSGTGAWTDRTEGIPSRFVGFPLVTSPYAIDTTHRIILSPLGKVTVVWGGNFAVDFNESLGWAANETWVKAYTHADFSLGNPAMHHKAVFTNLA